MRILAIDIGSTSIRAVEMDSAFGRYDIHEYHERYLENDETAPQAVQKLVLNLPKAPDRIIVALPQKYATFRNLQLPTRDKKAIQSGIKFELEDDLPFAPDASIFEHAILQTSKQGSRVYVTATLKAHLQNQISLWKNASIDPDIITPVAWALRALFNKILNFPEKTAPPSMFVGLGRHFTTLYLHHNGAPVLIREIHFGGQNITLALAKKLGVSEAEAESLKKDRGFLIASNGSSDKSEEENEIFLCIQEALQPLLLELKKTEIICKHITDEAVENIYLGGGTALIPGMIEWLEEKTSISTQLLKSLSSVTNSGVNYSEQTDARLYLALALSLCQVGNEKSSCINFRKGEFAKEVYSREINMAVLKKPLIGAGIVAASLFLSLIIQSTVYRSRLASTDTQLRKEVQSFFGQLSNSGLKTYLANTSTLRSSMKKEINKQKELARLFGPNPRSPLDFLKTISQSIPKSIVVNLTFFQTGIPSSESYSIQDKPTTSLTFQITELETVDKLFAILNTKMDELQKGKLEEITGTENSPKKWKITFSGIPNEESYGK